MGRADDLVVAGDQSLREKDLDAAEAAYREAIAIDPDHTEALHSIGYVEISRGRFEEAVNALQRALDRDPAHRNASQLLGNAYLGLQRYSDAKRAFLAVLDDDARMEMVGQIGLCCEGEGNFEEAEEWLRRALGNDPSYVTRYASVAMYHYGPVPSDLHHALARVLQRQEKIDEAKLHYHLSKRNDATVVLDPMYREIMTDADLENHVGFDAPPEQPAGGLERLVWLAQQDEWERVRAAIADFGETEVRELAQAIHAAQSAHRLYVAARLRVVGDIIQGNAHVRAVFDAVQSRSWRHFFELVERFLEEEIDADEYALEWERLEFDWQTFPHLLHLLRRFLEIELSTGLAVVEAAHTLSTRSPEFSQRVKGSLLRARALHRSRRSDQALELIEEIREAARDSDAETFLDVLHHQAMICGESGGTSEALAPLSELVERAAAGGFEEWELQARISRAQAYLALDRAEDARADGERIIEFGDRAARAHAPGAVARLLDAIVVRTGRPFSDGSLVGSTTAGEDDVSLYRCAVACAEDERYDEAIELLERAEHASLAAAHRAGAALAMALRAQLLAQTDRLDEAADLIQATVALGEPLGAAFDLHATLMLAGRIASAREETDEAVGFFERAVELVRAQDDEPRAQESLRALSMVLFDSDPDRALSLFSETMQGGSNEKHPVEWREAAAAQGADDLSGAIDAYERLLAKQDPESSELHPFALVNKAQSEARLGQIDAAIDSFRQAIAMFRTAGDDRRVGDCMAKLVLTVAQSGADPMGDLRKLVKLAEGQETDASRRDLSRIAGETAFEVDALSVAEPLLLTTVEIASEGDWRDAREEFQARATLGQIFRRRQQFEDSIGHYERAVELVDHIGDPQAEAIVCGNMAVALRYLDRFDEAVTAYERAIEIGERLGLPQLCANQRMNLAQCLYLMGRNASATSVALQAYRFFDSQAMDDMALRTLLIVYQHAGRSELPDELHDSMETLVPRTLESDDIFIRCWGESQMAVACARAGRLDEGEAYIRTVTAHKADAGDRYNGSRTWLGWARAVMDHDAERARVAAERAHTLAVEIDQTALLAECEEELCSIHLRLDEGEKALAMLASVEKRWELLRTALSRDIDRVRFADRTIAVLAEFTEFHLRKGRPGRALEVADVARAPALLDLSPDEDVGAPSTPAMAALLALLGADATLVHLSWVGDELTALTLRPSEDRPEVHPTGVSRADVDTALDEFDHEIRLYRGEGACVWEQRIQPVFAAIDARIPAGGNLVLVAEEELSPLPLHAVPLGDGTRLLERACVTYAPSMRVLAALAARRIDIEKMHEMVAIGVAFQDEALALSQRFGVQGLTGNHLVPKHALEFLENARVAHFACHGHFDPGNHLECGLVLRNSDDYMARDVLTVRELLERRVELELVVLSACETGRGIVSASDYLGLGRAWLAAGARATVSALWNVENEATQRLMLDYYGRLLRSGPSHLRNAAEALRAAQVEASRTAGFYDWAAFRLTGWPLLSPLKEPK